MDVDPDFGTDSHLLIDGSIGYAADSFEAAIIDSGQNLARIRISIPNKSWTITTPDVVLRPLESFVKQ